MSNHAWLALTITGWVLLFASLTVMGSTAAIILNVAACAILIPLAVERYRNYRKQAQR